MRTPKAGEEWVWMPCEKHRFKQLRDLVVVGRDFEDQADFVQKDILEHVECGCRFPADDPVKALADLRRDEEQYKLEMLAKVAAIERQGHRAASLNWGELYIVALTCAAIFGLYLCSRMG